MHGRKSSAKPIETLEDPRLIKALSHPLRVRILALLEERTASPVKLADLLGADLGVVSYHVRRLEQFGLIELVKETPRRGAVEHHYRARKRPTISDQAWGLAAPIAKQAYLASFLQQMTSYTHTAAACGGFDRPDAHFTRTIARLDAQGWGQLAQACTDLLSLIDRLEAESADRISADPHAADVTEAGLVVLLFEAARLSDQPSPAAARPRTRSRAAPAA